MRRFIPIAVAFSLAACAHQSPHMLAEKTDTDAQYVYVTIATLVNKYEALPGANVTKANAIVLEAWKALEVERKAYALTGTVNLTALKALLVQAKGL